MSAIMRSFVTTWCEAAEVWLDKWEEATTPIGALRNTLRIVEQTEGGKLQVGFLGMALVIITSHWELAGDPQNFFDSMTSIEQNLYADVAALKLLSMELEAQRTEGTTTP